MNIYRLAASTIIIIAAAVLPRDVNAQRQFGIPVQAEEAARRDFIIQVGMGTTFPIMHLGANEEFDDGFATSSSTLVFRAYFPFTSTIDIMADLSLPKFKVDHREFRNQNSMAIDDAFYIGKTLSLGARWFAMPSITRKGFLMASAGMYQLNWDRFLDGRRDKYTTIFGGFKPGFSTGFGMQFKFGPVSMDGVLRFHNFLDSSSFGENGLSWLELSFQAAIIGSKQR